MLEKIKEHERRFSTPGTAVVCCMAMLVITFWSYEKHVPEVVMKPLRIVALIAAILLWIYVSFMRGLIKRTAFTFFTAFYFLLPVFIVQYTEKMTDPKTYDPNLALIGNYCRLIGIMPFQNMPVLKDVDPLTASVIFSSICIVVFIIGMLVGGKDAPQGPAAESNETDTEETDD